MVETFRRSNVALHWQLWKDISSNKYTQRVTLVGAARSSCGLY